MNFLLLINHQNKEESVEISAFKLITIGRNKGCRIKLDYGFISRYHCTLIKNKDDTYTLEDGNPLLKTFSSRGTYLNNNKIIGKVTLKPGDTITFGDGLAHPSLRFIMEGQLDNDNQATSAYEYE